MSPSRSDTTLTNHVHEHTPLLSDVEAAKPKVTPVPRTQLGGESFSLFFDSIQLTLFIVIISIRITEPIIFSQIFPYINNFLSDLNVVEDPKRIGFYSGLVVCFHPLLFGVVNTWTFFRRAPLRLLSCCQFITSRSSATNMDVNPSFSLV